MTHYAKNPSNVGNHPIFNHFFGNNIAPAPQATKANVAETDDDFTIELLAAGYKKADFKIIIEQNYLRISTEPTPQTAEQKAKYIRYEFAKDGFERAFHLPKTIDVQAITADYAEGILTIHLPKKPEAKPTPARTISLG